MTNQKLYTTRELAEFLNLHLKTVIRMINRKEIEAIKVAGRWRVTEEALSEFLEQSERN